MSKLIGNEIKPNQKNLQFGATISLAQLFSFDL